MKTSGSLFVLTLLLYLAAGLQADDGVAKTTRPSLEQRVRELEDKLKDAGVGDGVWSSGIKIGGYVDTSYLLNLADRTETGPVAGSGVQNTGRVFDRQFDAFNLNAVKVAIEKAKDAGRFPAGFRADLMMGEDANVLDGTGAVNDSKLFLEQAYVNLGVPIGNGIDVRLGKMAALIGYEVTESPSNWQFSRSDGYRLVPATHTGAMATYPWNDHFSSTVAVVNGFDGIGAGNGAINYNTDLSLVGRLDGTVAKTTAGDFSAYLAGMYGNDDTGNTSATLNSPNNALVNVGVTWNRPFAADPLTLAFEYLHRESDRLGTAWAANVQPQVLTVTADAFSQYGQWKWNSWLASSCRFSYTAYRNAGIQDGVGNPLSLDPTAVYSGATRDRNTELYSFTLTQAFNVWKDTLLRLEWRRDWTPSPHQGFGTAGAVSHDDIRKDQDTLAVNVVYSF